MIIKSMADVDAAIAKSIENSGRRVVCTADLQSGQGQRADIESVMLHIMRKFDPGAVMDQRKVYDGKIEVIVRGKSRGTEFRLEILFAKTWKRG
jgi:hypothetical protein